jgi:2-octaprenylphenol hydroxylase
LADQRYDIVIVGGGMVGAALAIALAREEFAVCVLEARVPPNTWAADSHDLRVSAITRASQRLLDNLGVWATIAADRATPYQQMHVWDRTGFGEIHFDAADLAEPDLGHIVENRVIVRALWQQFDAAGVRVQAPSRLQQLAFGDHGATLTLDDGDRIASALVVAADGARSQVRELAGIASRSEPYDQHALVATVHAELGNQSTAWQRFMVDGPLALLPLEDELFSIVWSTRPDEAERLKGLPEADFNAELTAASEARLGTLTLQGERGVFPLRLQHAEHYVQPGLALVGDAAHVIHPLAGQGVNLGFLDAGALVDALLAGREAGRKPGNLRSLRAYERSRRGHNTATQLAMDGFKHLFSNDRPALSLLRNVGIGAAGRIAPLRRVFERVALGHGVELPSLARPSQGEPTG